MINTTERTTQPPRKQSPDVKDPERLEIIAGLAAVARDKPTSGNLRRLANASLVFGLANSERLSVVVSYVSGRMCDLADDAIVELDRVLAEEQRRRADG